MRAPKVDLDAISERAATLGLVYVAECLSELVEEAAREDLPPVRFLERVLEREADRKNERRVATSLKLSGLPVGRTLEGFDWTFQPRADRQKFEMLSTCAYVRARENVLFLGPPGVGKSHLAAALGVKAVKNGFSVTHFVLDDLMHALKADAAVPPARLKAKRYLSSSLLIVDEVGFRPLDRHEANLFFRLISARYAGQHHTDQQQACAGLAGGLRWRRSARDGDPGPAPPPRPRGAHRRQELPPEGAAGPSSWESELGYASLAFP
jgi:DNA replication protein DnaC